MCLIISWTAVLVLLSNRRLRTLPLTYVNEACLAWLWYMSCTRCCLSLTDEWDCNVITYLTIWGPGITVHSALCSLLCRSLCLAKPSRLHRLQVLTSAHIQGLILLPECLIYTPQQEGGLMTCQVPTLLSLPCIALTHLILCICLTVLPPLVQVPRHAGSPYTAHDITKGHPNLAGTPPGHAHSPALSQVSVPTASPYRYPKGWEAGGGVSLLLWPPSSSLHIYVGLFLCPLSVFVCVLEVGASVGSYTVEQEMKR